AGAAGVRGGGACGGSGGRIIQQLLAEGLLLGVGGGLAGFAGAAWGVRWLLTIFGAALPRSQDVAIDGRVLAFTTATALVTGLLAAFVPAWQLSGRDANTVLKTRTRRRHTRGRDGA